MSEKVSLMGDDIVFLGSALWCSSLYSVARYIGDSREIQGQSN